MEYSAQNEIKKILKHAADVFRQCIQLSEQGKARIAQKSKHYDFFVLPVKSFSHGTEKGEFTELGFIQGELCFINEDGYQYGVDAIDFEDFAEIVDHFAVKLEKNLSRSHAPRGNEKIW